MDGLPGSIWTAAGSHSPLPESHETTRTTSVTILIKLMRLVLALSALSGLPQIGLAQNTISASKEKDKETLLRRIRFGHRELTLPQQLQNDDLDLKNHGLENDIAQLEGRPQDINLERITVDRFLLEQDKAALMIANWFAQVWSKSGDEELQRKLSDIERQFDKADKKCHPDTEPNDEATVPIKTLDEVEAACAALHDIYLTVSKYHITASVPPPSVFKHSNTLNSTGETLLRADKLQLTLDRAAHIPAQIKKELIDGDQILINMDRMIWLQDIIHADTIKYNNAHPEDQVRDNSDIMRLFTDGRQKMTSINNKERRDLLNLRQKGR